MDILDIFYNSIIKEAANGRINCLVYYNILFSTKICTGEEYVCQIENSDLLIPTLIIKDKDSFDALLIEYVNMALDFYDDKNYPEEILDYKRYDKKDKICKEKVILAMLFANATVEDFNNPCEFLQKRIDFIRNDISCRKDLGYLEIFKGDVSIEIREDIINNETPYQMIIRVINDSGDEYIFPRIKLGVSNDKLYIYAIQNNLEDINRADSFFKKVNRILYKTGEGFNLDESENEEKLKDVTSSFLVSLNMCISYFNCKGYSSIVVPSFLIERWNAKSIANLLKVKYKKLDDTSSNKLSLEQEYIQNNLTNKLIRTFLRLGCHNNNIEIISLPYEMDSNLHININNNEFCCNNLLLYQTYKLIENSDKKHRK